MKDSQGLLPTPPSRFSLIGDFWSREDSSGKKATIVIPDVKSPAPELSPTLPITSTRPVLPIESERVSSLDREMLLTRKTRIGDETVTAKLKNTFLEFHLDDNEMMNLRRSVSWCGAPLTEPECHEEGHCPPPRVPPPPPPSITTYMIRNIPTRFTSMSFVRLLEEYGFGKTFDFFYLPMDFRSGKNMGYAFINFKASESGLRFVDKFNLKRLPVSTSRKIVEVYPSRRQGLLENVSLFRTSDLLSSSVSLPYYKPLVAVEDGTLVPLSDVNFLVK